MFSYYMAEGLKGAGDRDGNGYIVADELFTYVADSVRFWTKRHGDKQTPRKKMNVTGSILIGYHPENLAQIQQEAAQETFDAYQKKLRAITALRIAELAQAEALLRRDVMGEPLTKDEQKWADLVRGLVDEKVSIDVYRLAIKRLKSESLIGSIFVKSEPSGAKVTLDDVLQKERTPMTIADVMAGPYALKVTLNGYKDWGDTIHVKAGETEPVNAKLIQILPPHPGAEPAQNMKKGSNMKWYLVGGAMAIGGGVAAALLSGGGEGTGDETTDTGSLTVSINVP